MNNEDIGYLKRAVEDLTNQTRILHQIVKDHMAREEIDRAELLKHMKHLQDRIQLLENEQIVNRAILQVLKWIGGAVVAILMVNLGDVSGIFQLLGFG